MLTRLITLFFLGVLPLALSCQQPANNASPPIVGLNDSLQVLLEVPAEAKAGELVPFKLKLKNVSDSTLNVWGGGLPYDFIVVTPEGADVFRYAIVRPLVLRRIVIQPGITKEYQVARSQRYKRDGLFPGEFGTPTIGMELGTVPPGDYLVRGSLEVSLSDKPDMELIVTDPLLLRIRPVPDPTYPTRSVQLPATVSDPATFLPAKFTEFHAVTKHAP